MAYIKVCVSFFRQEGIPEVQETYSMSYQTSTSTNGHHGDGDASSNNSQSMVPVDNASLISRSTSQTKTQQVCSFLFIKISQNFISICKLILKN